MTLALDYNADIYLQGIDPSAINAERKRSPHLSHYLLSGVRYNNAEFDLVLKEDQQATAMEKTAARDIHSSENEPLITDDWHLPALVAVTDEMTFAEAEERNRNNKTIKDRSSATIATAEEVKHLQQTKKEVQEFSSYQSYNSNKDMEESNFLQWIKHKNAERSSPTKLTHKGDENDIDEGQNAEEIAEDEVTSTTAESVNADAKNEHKKASFKNESEDETSIESPTDQHEEKIVSTESEDEPSDNSTHSEMVKSTNKKRVSRKESLKKAIEDSVSLGDEIISETLANLLANHGHSQRARKMYEKLRLLFPNKSSYFAEKIQKLNKSK